MKEKNQNINFLTRKKKSLPWSKTRKQLDSCRVVFVKPPIEGGADLRNDFLEKEKDF